jgi:hypothetical protein
MRIFEGNNNIYSLDLSSNKLPSNPFALEMLFKPSFNDVQWMMKKMTIFEILSVYI